MEGFIIFAIVIMAIGLGCSYLFHRRHKRKYPDASDFKPLSLIFLMIIAFFICLIFGL